MRHAARALRFTGIALLAGCSSLLVDSYDYGRIDVRATLESGEPAEGIPVLLYRDVEHLAYGVTDSQGEYTFAFVPYNSVGVYLQLLPRYITSDSLGSDYRDGIDVSDGGTATAVFSGLIRVEEEPPPPQALSFPDHQR